MLNSLYMVTFCMATKTTGSIQTGSTLDPSSRSTDPLDVKEKKPLTSVNRYEDCPPIVLAHNATETPSPYSGFHAIIILYMCSCP